MRSSSGSASGSFSIPIWGMGSYYTLWSRSKELFVKPRSPPSRAAAGRYVADSRLQRGRRSWRNKMVNCRQLDYPADKLRLVWITDGSNDNTNERLKEYPEVTVLYQPRRQGKTAALNRALPYVNTPYVIFTDANTMLNKGAIKEIIRQFSDPRVGCVAGEKRVEIQSRARSHRRRRHILEIRVRPQATGLPPILRRRGGRRTLRHPYLPSSSRCPRIPYWTISSLSLRIAMKGYKIAYSKEAYALESASLNMREEEKRKSTHIGRRIAIGMAATGIIEYLPVRDTELPIHQPPGTALDADAGRALRPPAPQPSPSLYRAYPLYTVIPCPAISVLPAGILGV